MWLTSSGWATYFQNEPQMDNFISAELYRQRFQIEGIKAMINIIQSSLQVPR